MPGLRAVACDGSHDGGQQCGRLFVHAHHPVFDQLRDTAVAVLSPLAQELVAGAAKHDRRIGAPVCAERARYLGVADKLGHAVGNFHFKFEVEVARESAGSAHWESNSSLAGGTLYALLGFGLIHFLLKALAAEGMQTRQESWVSERLITEPTCHLIFCGHPRNK